MARPAGAHFPVPAGHGVGGRRLDPLRTRPVTRREAAGRVDAGDKEMSRPLRLRNQTTLISPRVHRKRRRTRQPRLSDFYLVSNLLIAFLLSSSKSGCSSALA